MTGGGVDTQSLVTIVVALLTGGFLKYLIDWLRQLGKGHAERRSELRRAWDAVDSEARKRRLLEEYASCLRRLLFDAPCVDAATVPPYPRYKQETDKE